MKFIKSFSSFINESEIKNTSKNLGKLSNLPEIFWSLKQFSLSGIQEDRLKKLWPDMKSDRKYTSIDGSNFYYGLAGLAGGAEIKNWVNPNGHIDIKSLKTPNVGNEEDGYVDRIFLPESNDANYKKGFYLEYNAYHERFLQPGSITKENSTGQLIDITKKFKCREDSNLSGIDKDILYFVPWGSKNPYGIERGQKQIVTAESEINSIEYVGKDSIKLSSLFTKKHAEVINQWLSETIAGSDASKFNLTLPVKYRLVGGSKGDTYTVNVNPLPGEFYGFSGRSIPLDLGRGKNYEDKFGEIYSTSIETNKSGAEIWIDIFNYDRGQGASSVSLIFENFPVRWNIPEHELTEQQARELKLKWERGMTVEVKHTTAESNYTWVRFAKEDLEKRLKAVEPYYINNDKVSSRLEKIHVKTNAVESFKNDVRMARAKMGIFISDHKRYAMWMEKHIDNQTDENIEKWNKQVEIFNKIEVEKNSDEKLQIFSEWYLENKEKDIHWYWMTTK